MKCDDTKGLIPSDRREVKTAAPITNKVSAGSIID
jgi:hypothetical protein